MQSQPAMFVIGDSVSVHFFSDVYPGRVVAVTKGGKVTVRLDRVIKDPDFVPRITPGGFAGHCENNQDEKPTWVADPNGRTMQFSLRVWGEKKVWTEVGSTPNGSNRITHGARYFYDRNF